MQLILNIEKKHLWFIVLAVVAVGVVVAFNTNNPPVMGHSLGEIEGIDQRITEVMNIQSTTFLSGKQLIEGRRYTLGTQHPVFTPSPPWNIETLAQYTNIYTGNNDRGGFQGFKGCTRAITEYCQNQGYGVASVVSTTCGAAFAGDASCPDMPGCSITFYCFKEK